MRIAKIFTTFFLVVSCFAGGLYGAPMASFAYHRLLPEPQFKSGDFSALHTRARSQVVLFSTSICPYCKKTRELFDTQHIAYVDYIVDQSKEAEELFDQHGGGGVPLIYIGAREIRGLREPAIYAALAAVKKTDN